MQSDYYRSPCATQENNIPACPVKKRRKWPAVVAFTVPIALLLTVLIVLHFFSPELRQIAWADLIPNIESSFQFEFPEELLPEEFQDEFDGFQEEFPPISSTAAEKETLPYAPLAPNVELILTGPAQPMSFQEIYASVIPSIVSIEVYGSTGSASGTGVIMTEDGYIITNHHIIAGYSQCFVVLSDGAEYEAKLVGSDVESDLAVLKIQAQGLTCASFGNSDLLQVGDTVLAIGNPLGSELFGTLTDGIVSAINRNVHVDGYTMTLIQTNAALNPGNSGGALINTSGQVIGITNMKMMSDYETIEGLGFAIPTTWAKEIVDTLLDQGKITGRPTIGITCFALVPGSEAYYGRDSGIYIETVTAGSPADQAGLQSGDIILTANGVTVTTLEEFTAVRDEAGVDGVLELTFWRSGVTRETNLVLADQYELQ